MPENIINKLKHQYLINQVKKAKIPVFPNAETIRKKIIFSGKVQKVGFRFQVCLLAEKMNLKGKVKNRDSGEVELDIQGTEAENAFLVKYMQSRKRLKITKIEEVYLPLDSNLDGFSMDKATIQR